MGAITSTTYEGNWYLIIGSAGSACEELNRINAKSDRVISVSGIVNGDVILFVGRP